MNSVRKKVNNKYSLDCKLKTFASSLDVGGMVQVCKSQEISVERSVSRGRGLHSYFFVLSLSISSLWKARLTSGGSHGGSVCPLAIPPSLSPFSLESFASVFTFDLWTWVKGQKLNSTAKKHGKLRGWKSLR